MGVRSWVEGWPAYRQATGTDPMGRGAAVKSKVSARLAARTATADAVVKSVCPYCAVGCGQNVYVGRARRPDRGRPRRAAAAGAAVPQGLGVACS